VEFRFYPGYVLPPLIRCPALGNGRFEELGGEMLGRDQLDEPFARRGKEDLELFDCRVVAPRLEERGDELGVLAVVGRSEVMGTGAEALHPVAQVVAIQFGIELSLERVLFRRICGSESEDRFVRGV